VGREKGGGGRERREDKGEGETMGREENWMERGRGWGGVGRRGGEKG